MVLTKTGRYAVCAVLDMINNIGVKPVRIEDIADRQNIPVSYLKKLFRKLRVSGIVCSVRGPGGGYIMNKDPEIITIKELLQSVEPPVVNEFTKAKSYYTAEFNKTRERLDEQLEKHTTALLETITLSDLLK